MEQIGISDALGAMNLRAIVHAAEFGPAFLGHGYNSIPEFENDDGVVITAGFALVHRRTHLGIDRFDPRPAKHPTKVFDGMATHVHGHPAAGAIYVPEMRRVRTVMLFGLLEQHG